MYNGERNKGEWLGLGRLDRFVKGEIRMLQTVKRRWLRKILIFNRMHTWQQGVEEGNYAIMEEKESYMNKEEEGSRGEA